jgi:hypothetical protein
MRKITGTTCTEWVLQAYLAVSPRSPRWTAVSFCGVVGWQEYQRWTEDQKVWRDPRLVQWGFNTWSFVSRDAAVAVLQELLAYEQKYWLRVIERSVYVDEWFVAGFDITNGTVIKNTKGEAPRFMGKPVACCVEDLPKRVGCACTKHAEDEEA